MAAKRVVILAFDDMQLLDLAGPVEALTVADFLAGDRLYERVLLSPTGAPVRSSSGLEMTVGHSLADEAASRRRIDTLLVVGGFGVYPLCEQVQVVAAVARLASRARRVASVCSGAFLLAAAGLLDGRSATTHWSVCDDLAGRFPEVRVEPDRIFVVDGPVWTSAGITAGIDLTLALVAADHGDTLAQQVASWLVVYSRRPGGQSQFSFLLRSQASAPGMTELLAWITSHLDADLSVASLAQRAAMSPRTFARTFARRTGTTPAAYVERARIQAACDLLSTTDSTMDVVAEQVGFTRVETFHRAFRRATGTTPDAFRRHFAVA